MRPIDAAVFAEQIAQVDRRVANLGDAFAEDSLDIRRAVEQVDVVRSGLDLGELVRSLNPGTGKPQLLLLFRDRLGSSVVLKVYGHRRPNEAAVQASWAAAGISAVAVISAGDDPVSWLLMPYIEGAVPTVTPGLTTEVATLVRPAHELPPADVGQVRDLHTGIAVHLRNCLSAVRAHGYPVPVLVEDAADRWYRAGDPRHLHGDLTPLNLLRTPTGGLLMLDTCGYTGPAEFDAARWCARVGGSRGASRLLREWSAVEQSLDPTLADRLLGLELAMEAGVREKRKQERSQDPRPRDPETAQLVDAAVALLEGPA